MKRLLNGYTTQTHNTYGQVKVFQKAVDIFLGGSPARASNKKRITGYIKGPHTATFTGQTKCGKTHLVLELIEKGYNKHFDYIVIICPTLKKILPIMLKGGLKTVLMFGLWILKTSSTKVVRIVTILRSTIYH